MSADDNPEEILADAKSSLRAIDVDKRSPFPVHFFAKKSPSTLKLIEQKNENISVKASHRWFSAYFENPQIVSIVRIYYKNLSTRPSFKVSFRRHSDGKIISIKRDEISFSTNEAGNSYLEARIFQLIDDVSFEPPKSMRAGRAIIKFDVFGYSQEDFEDAMSQTLDVFSLKARVDRDLNNATEKARSTINQADALKEEIEKDQNQLDALEKENTALSDKRNALNQQLSKLESDILERDKALSITEENISRRTDRSATLASKNESLEKHEVELQEQLRDLQSQLDLFPAELSEFNEQGRGKSFLYFWLSFVPIGLIVGVTFTLFLGAADLSTKYLELENIDLTTLVASRIPFALIAIFILHVAFQLTKILIREIFRINRQQLALSKLSIVAQEVTKSSRNGLSLTDKEVFDLKTRLKMTLLRSHLKTYLDDEFEFEVESSIFSTMVKNMGLKRRSSLSEVADVAKHAIDRTADVATDVAEEAIKSS